MLRRCFETKCNLLSAASWKNCVDQYPIVLSLALQNIFGFYAEIVIGRQVLCPAKDTEKEGCGNVPFHEAHERSCIFPRFSRRFLKMSSKSSPLTKREDRMEQITVSSRRDKKVEVEVPIACEITWNVQVESYGIVLLQLSLGKKAMKGNKLLERRKLRLKMDYRFISLRWTNLGKSHSCLTTTIAVSDQKRSIIASISRLWRKIRKCRRQ